MEVLYSFKFPCLFNGKSVSSVTMEPPASDALIYLDKYRGKGYSFLKAIAVYHTKKIDENTVNAKTNLKQLEEFWGDVKLEDLKAVMIEIVKPNWPGEATEVPQSFFTDMGNYIPYPIDLSKDIEFNPEPIESIEIIPETPFVLDEKTTINSLTLRQRTVKQEEALQEYNEKPGEGMLRRIAVSLQPITTSDGANMQLDYAHIMRFPPRLRKRLESSMGELWYVQPMIKKNIGGVEAVAVLDITDFF
jgi:hypothetical protein